MRTRLATLSLVLLAATAAAQEIAPTASAPVNGFPNWEERVLHEWMNRARVAPSVDLAGCGNNCSAAELDPACYLPAAPLMWRYENAVGARFHADSMVRQGFFDHYTPCLLRTDLSTVYPGSCDGSAACACSGSGSTSPGTRLSRFSASYSGEIIAAGYGDPDSAFYGWLWESAPTAGCSFSASNGHRYLILTASDSLGAGYAEGGSWGRYYTTDFGYGGAASKLPSGAHYPRQAAAVDFWANWYDSQPPSDARVIIDSISYPMTLARGTSTNGAWTTTVNGLGTGCHRYYFAFADASHQAVRHPSSGTFGIGPLSTCADWVDTSTPVPAPTLTAAAATIAAVQVSWTASTGATQYQLERSAANVPFAPLATVAGTTYTDLAVSAGQTYLYRVRPAATTSYSNVDHATTVAFTDNPLAAGTTPIRTTHLSELRTAVNAVRSAAGLSPSSWTDPSAAGVAVRATHVLELRTSLSQAMTALGKSVTFTNPVTTGATVRALDLQELRNAVK